MASKKLLERSLDKQFHVLTECIFERWDRVARAMEEVVEENVELKRELREKELKLEIREQELKALRQEIKLFKIEGRKQYLTKN